MSINFGYECLKLIPYLEHFDALAADDTGTIAFFVFYAAFDILFSEITAFSM